MTAERPFSYWFGRHQLLGRRGYRRLGILCPSCRHGERAVVGYRLWCWHTHKQAWTRTPTGRAGVDRDLLPLLRELWALGVVTRYSCVGSYVGFNTADAAERALPVVRHRFPGAALDEHVARW